MKKIGILFHPRVEKAHELAQEMEKFLQAQGCTVWLCSAWESEKANELLDNTDLLLTSGGDGTILRGVHIALATGTPVTGINLGRLGFMTELSADEVIKQLPALLEGKGWLDERTMLHAEMFAPGEKEPLQTYHALNDVVIARGAIARLIGIDVSIDGSALNTYRADGVILATATGSTGYSLAVGGPILHPRSEDILLVPVAPHLGFSNSFVLAPDAQVRMKVSTTQEATLSVDGHQNAPLPDGSVITVRRSDRKARFLRIHPANAFYSSLEQKLKRKK